MALNFFRPYLFIAPILVPLSSSTADGWMQTLDYASYGLPIMVLSNFSTITNDGNLDMYFEGQPVCILSKG